MKYVEKYDCFIDEDLVVYRIAERNSFGRTKGNLYQIKFYTDKYGYLKTSYFVNGKTLNATLHKIVAEAFIPNPENKETVDHINRNKKDNRIENLRWASLYEQEENKERVIASKELHDGLRCKSGSKEECKQWRRIQYQLTIDRKHEVDKARYLRDCEKRKKASKEFYKKKSLTHKRVKLPNGKKVWVLKSVA